MQKLKVVACGVFEPELRSLAAGSVNDIQLCVLDAGLHEYPDELRERVQGEIDAARKGAPDGIVVVYGLCGRGTSGLVARDVPVAIPRVHDCISLFLGSAKEYRRQFSKHPGTYYITPGWFEKQREESRAEFTASESSNDSGDDGDRRGKFGDYAERFGADNAEHIIRFYNSWKGNYTRAAFINTGIGDTEQYRAYCRKMARDNDWDHEELAGDTSLLEDLLAGRWDDRRVFVLRAGQRSVLTGDDGIFEAIDIQKGQQRTDSEGHGEVEGGEMSREQPAVGMNAGIETTGVRDRTESSQQQAEDSRAEGAVGLGIDAGGTYTDCVLYDMDGKGVVGTAKAPTTHNDLMVGIRQALDDLRIDRPSEISLVALSTTLATNAIVEGRGATPGAIIMASRIGRSADIRWQPLHFVSGQMDIQGRQITAPDSDEVESVVDQLLKEGVDSFAVSGYAGVRNPEHELLVKQIINERCDLPVVCGHDLSSRLNFVSRANTAIMNARLLPLIEGLLDAVDGTLAERNIGGKLMVVKGDGTLASRQAVRQRPIETIMSGPAASVFGAKHLTGLEDAIVVDMGGTTTDTAVVEDGHVQISEGGARVGGRKTSVEAADISTIGLGGDSRLDFTGDRRLIIGPRRVLPMAYVCDVEPQAIEILDGLHGQTASTGKDAAPLDIFTISGVDGYRDLTDREVAIIEALEGGPMTRWMLADAADVSAPQLVPVDGLEGAGLVKRSALTPTDVLHATGEFTSWNEEAAKLAVEIFATLYGAPVSRIAEIVRSGVVQRLAGQVLRRELPEIGQACPDEWSSLLQYALRPERADNLQVRLNYRRPIVAIGAPVRAFMPQVGDLLGTEVIIPPNADVGNAVGAVASEVSVREKAVIRPGEIARFIVHCRSGRSEHETLKAAVDAARDRTGRLAKKRARNAGARKMNSSCNVDERRSTTAYGEDTLVEVQMETVVTGKPDIVEVGEGDE